MWQEGGETLWSVGMQCSGRMERPRDRESVWQEGGESRVESERHLEVGRLFSSS